jgi:hypothetical protein
MLKLPSDGCFLTKEGSTITRGGLMDWRPDVLIQGSLSLSSPVLASHVGVLHMVHRGDDSNSFWHARFDGSHWTENSIQGQLTQSVPALAPGALDG